MSHWESAGKSNEWYTPKYIFDALGCVFDMDVAGSICPAICVPAFYTLTEDSLKRSWSGFVWMNPPFEGRNGLRPWLLKFFQHGDGLALTPDRTSAPWFRYAWGHADQVMFVPKIKFHKPDGTTGDSPSCGTALWGVGGRACEALDRAQRKGLGISGIPRRVQ